MHLDMRRVEGKDEVQITVTSEPIKILTIENGYVLCQWENMRFKMSLPSVLREAILSKDLDEEMRDRFLDRLNKLLLTMGE